MTVTPLFPRRRRHHPRPVDTSIDWKRGLRPADRSRKPAPVAPVDPYEHVGAHHAIVDVFSDAAADELDRLQQDNDAVRELLDQAEHTITQLRNNIADHLDHINELTDQLGEAMAAKEQWRRSAGLHGDRNVYLREKLTRIAAAVNAT